MNFENCKKIFIKYLEGKMTKEEIVIWASKHCNNCKEKICHCEECPLFINGNCQFPI